MTSCSGGLRSLTSNGGGLWVSETQRVQVQVQVRYPDCLDSAAAAPPTAASCSFNSDHQGRCHEPTVDQTWNNLPHGRDGIIGGRNL
ncbi:hypothetical protein EYF80_037189 [Liparis tanakae]|uniref:Uncharacterized protein n=1 Tax=Liparis tanakae TaxID=230148 RepID=A0A4Z2GHE0_9TELE|nr:hypothetical protein EYF80_037189 [Liparis tanakae]